MPIVRPLFLVDPKAAQSWTNWWTYQYGPDLLVSPIWEKGKRTQDVYVPTGSEWRDAWNPEKNLPGSPSITVNAGLHQCRCSFAVGSNLSIGDLNQEWKDSLEIAQKHPD